MEKLKTGKYDLSKVDPTDPKSLDSFHLDKRDYRINLLKFIVISAIAILVFFIPLGDLGILFGVLYNGLISLVDNIFTYKGVKLGSLLICTIILVCTGLASVYGKYFAKKDSKFSKYFEADSIIHPILYMLGGFYILMYFLDQTGIYHASEMIVGESTAGLVIPGVVIGVAAIIPIGAFFIPFLTDYGLIDFVGVLLEPIMRPAFKVPGKAAVDASASFVGSTTMGIIITGRMYRTNNYTQQEAAVVATCFSAVSVGYAYVVMETAKISEHFVPTYFVSFGLAFVMAAIISRLWPISKKPKVYYDGREQTEAERREARMPFGPKMLKTGIDRGTKRAFISGNMPQRIVRSIIDSFPVLPKVITLLCAFGISGMILAKYTPIFDYLGYLFYPLTKLLGVPDAMEAAAAIPTGITEMFIPVMTIADVAASLHVKTRFFVTVVSMLQIIFLAESVVVIMNTGIPVKFKELMIVFLERTIIAMPLAALFMHLLF